MHHRRRYTAQRLRRQAQAAGWQPGLVTYFFTTMLPLVALARALRRLSGFGGENSDLTLGPAVLGRLLEAPVQGEAQLIRRGLRLPFGVSLGMVCTAR
jgi:hypothetical protein